jgi:hypothetical protein
VTILLVVVGTISLVIGFVQSSLLPIYISIACSVLAAAVLLIFSRMTAKSQQVVTSDAGPAPLGGRTARGDRTEPVPAFAGSGLLSDSSPGEAFAAPEPAYGAGGPDDEDDVVEDDDFPIERYDSRRVGEILPLLAELDVDELDLVREREEQGKSRATVLARIDQLIDQLEAEDRHEAATRLGDGEASAAVAAPAGLGGDEPDEADDDEPVPPPVVAPAPRTQPVSVAALPDDDGYFPIEDYDDLRASEILPLLPELDDDELGMVRDRERASAARPSVLRRIDALLAPSGVGAPDADADGAPGLDEPMPAPVITSEVPSAPAVRKTASKRAPAAKKAPAKRAAPEAAPARPRKTARAAAPAPAPVVAPPAKRAPAKRAAPAPPAKAAVKKARPVATSEAAAPGPVKKAAQGVPTKSTTKKAAGPKVTTARAAGAGKAAGATSATKAAKVTRKAAKG